MLTQTFSYKGLGELCPIFSKMAFMFLLLFVAFASQEVNGQIVIVIEDVNGLTESSSSSYEFGKREKPFEISLNTQLEIFPNPFSSELSIRVSPEEGLNYLSLANESGQIVWEQNVFSIPDKFIIESLDAGTYYLTLSMQGGNYTETVIYSP